MRDDVDCGECAAHLCDRYWLLREACASVGIEYGKSTEQVMDECMAAFHARGHRVQ